MINGTLNQFAFAILAAWVGIVCGFVYDCFSCAKKLIRKKVFLKHLIDAFAVVLCAAFYIFVIWKFMNFDIKFYILAFNLIGFFIERNSIGIMLAYLVKMLYNLCVDAIRKKEHVHKA